MRHILHEELFSALPFPGNGVAHYLDDRADASFQSYHQNREPVTVAIRTLNEEERLEQLLEDVRVQNYRGEVEVVVVDNESTDRTAQVARSAGATVVNLAREDFSYPRTMNLAMEAASNNNVFLTVGHARLTTDRLLSGGAFQLARSNVAGAFAYTLPNDNASWIEKLQSVGNRTFMKEKQVQKTGLGIMAATCAMVSKEVWEDLGRFDERYASGGEDAAMAGRMIEAGFLVIAEPLLSVHHTHGLGLLDTAKQWLHWMKTVKGPLELDMEQLAARRPDLDLS